MASHCPIASICVPTYNRSRMLHEALKSALSQTFEDFEIIVSDNASADDTESVVRSFGDPRVRYYRQSTNIGTVPNLNFTLGKVRGRCVTFLFDDDLMLPENLARKVTELNREGSVGLVHSRYHIVDEVGRLVRASTNQGHGVERAHNAVEAGHVFLERMLAGVCEVNPSSTLFRRECIERLGVLDERLSHCDDYEYWMRISVFYDVAYIAEPLVKWRVHSQTHTNKYMVRGKTGISVDSLRDELRAKYKIIHCYRKDIPGVEALSRRLRAQIEERVVFQIESMLDDGMARKEARAVLYDMCRNFPSLAGSVAFWKVVLKTWLSRRGINVLKKLSF